MRRACEGNWEDLSNTLQSNPSNIAERNSQNNQLPKLLCEIYRAKLHDQQPALPVRSFDVPSQLSFDPPNSKFASIQRIVMNTRAIGLFAFSTKIVKTFARNLIFSIAPVFGGVNGKDYFMR
jgi:hypothetical protein